MTNEMDFNAQYSHITNLLLEKYARSKPGGNIILSPFSVIMMLGIAAASTAGETREEIVRAIGGGLSAEELREVLRGLQKEIGGSGVLTSANAVCVKEEIRASIAEGYEERLAEDFGGKLFASRDIVGDVNAWVREHTRGMIERIADESMREMLACLLNAALFEAGWQRPYEEWDVGEGEFTNADGSGSEVQMLHSRENTYIEDEACTGFVKPYRGFAYGFAALLPKEEGEEALQKLLKEADLSERVRGGQFDLVDVTMPEFQGTFGEELTEFCRELGIRTVFTPGADFSPMSDEWLKMDGVIHKAHIEVDRKGTRAAAATMGVIAAGAAMPQRVKSVVLDRPFVYAIVHMKTGLPVFCGVMRRAE